MSGSALPDPIVAAAVSPWTPASSEDRDAVLQQLDRMLAHPSFRNSKRYSSLFRYVVERTLRGDRNLKERLLGIEVFGRDPDYDTNDDPVVRVTAGETRRRIAQYYYEAGHDAEIRIELQPGSYNPVFRLPARSSSAADTQPISARTGIAPAPKLVEEAGEQAQTLHERRQSTTRPSLEAQPATRLPALAIAAMLAIVCVGAVALLWSRMAPPSTVDQFWAPVLARQLPVLICIPDLDSNFANNAANASGTTPFAQAMTSLGRDYRRAKVAFSDSVSLANLTKLLGSKGAGFRIKRSEDASLDDLKGGPVVLVAGGNNRWSIQLGKQLRYTYEREGDTLYIGDAENPASRQWSVVGPDMTPNPVDYAIISRVFDATTGEVLVTAAGLHHNGTEAAGICLASETCLQQAGKMAPGDWSKVNIQLVVATTVLGDAPGQPRVVAARIW